MSRLLKTNLLEDVFNVENESFMQETELKENEYSVNLRTRFWFRGKTYDGWINLVNIFRATMVLGTPGSGNPMRLSISILSRLSKKDFPFSYMISNIPTFPRLLTTI